MARSWRAIGWLGWLVVWMLPATAEEIAAIPPPLVVESPSQAGVSAGVYSKYLFRGSRLASAGLATDVQAVLVGDRQVAFEGQFWHYYEFSPSRSYERRVDLDVAFTGVPLHTATATVVCGWVNYDRAQGPSTQEVYVTAALDLIPTPTFTVAYDYDRQVGFHLSLDLQHQVRLNQDWSFDASAELGLDFGRRPGWFNDFGLRTALTYRSGRLYLQPAVDWWAAPAHVNRKSLDWIPSLTLGYQCALWPSVRRPAWTTASVGSGP